MGVYYLFHHMDSTHIMILTQNRVLYVGRGGPETYRVSFTRVLKFVAFLVDR